MEENRIRSDEETQLLLQDLSGRLTYGVILNIQGQDGHGVFNYNEELWSLEVEKDWYSINERGTGNDEGINEIRPYLRPMSTLSEEEIEELMRIENKRKFLSSLHLTWNLDGEIIDWLNRKMIDWRGLIPQGIALTALPGIYEEKKI